MTTQVQPLSKVVRDAIRRTRSPARHVSPALRKTINLVMFAAIVCGSVLGVASLWRMAVEDPRFRINGDTLGIAGAVRECPESVDELQRIGMAFNGRSILDPGLIGDLERAFQESVWVKKVTRMRRSFPNRVDLELLQRIPVAQVKNNQRFWLVDGDGVLLPVEGAAVPFENLPEIVGVTSQMIVNRPIPGEAWKDDGVTGALAIMRTFWGSSLSDVLPVRRIVVNTGVFRNADGVQREVRRRYEIVSDAGVVVRWGTYNPMRGGDELTNMEKMANLQDLLSRDEALRPGVSFDVRTSLPGFSLNP